MKEQPQHQFNDKLTSINQLKLMVREFVQERDWEKYHTPKNIAVSVTLEASELLEHFQWTPQLEEVFDENKKQQIGEEMSDVMAYLLSLANVLDIDISSAMAAKMKKNRKKYPVEDLDSNLKKLLNTETDNL